jgi:TM2 domain-containing membrane protein YozV
LERVENDTHSIPFGYVIWLFGFTGAHRFYYGKPITGTLWFCTFGLLGVGWLIDFFLISSMDRKADLKFREGIINYNIAWILLVYLGYFGIHRFYMRKWFTGVLWLFTGGLFTIGWLYDFWTLNQKVSEQNKLLR